MIEFKNVYKPYPNGFTALKDINLKIEQGEFVAIIGLSGAGKSTLADIILGLLTPHSGEILVDNTKLNENNFSEFRKLIGYVPQQINVIEKSFKENVAWGIDYEKILAGCSAVLVGCGLGNNEDTAEIVKNLCGKSNVPLVIDADGINALCGSIDIIKKRKAPVILTPHPGEMSRLTGLPIPRILENPAACATEYARRVGCVCVLKDHRTAVADGSGRVFCNTTGNSGMATGGSGDVLAGILGGLMAQGRDGTLSLADTAALGV